mmetsp:Transcript_108408/g.192005  ORF Transcript_108408/g.192005 Transcript_108408/m.192005 type:complete len:473 (-) Transcript_108408:224-1642(-)
MHMNIVAFVFACLAFTSHGRRVLMSTERLPSSQGLLQLVDAVPTSDLYAEAHHLRLNRRACGKVICHALLALSPAAAFDTFKFGAFRKTPLAAQFRSLQPHTVRLPKQQRNKAPIASAREPDFEGLDDDDDDYYSARLLTPGEQAAVLDDWMSRTRIYRMSRDFGNEELAEIHTDALARIEALRGFETSPSFAENRSGRMVLGLFDKDEVWAVAAGEVSRSKGLVVCHLCINPVEVNHLFDEGATDLDDSGAVQGILSALDELAENMDMPLDITPLHEEDDDEDDDFWTGRDDFFTARLLSPVEQATLLDDWITRTRIYSQIGDFGGDEDLAEVHADALKWLIALRNLKISASVTKQNRFGRMLVALNDENDKIRALAAADATKKKGLVVSRLVLDPSEVNNLWESGARGYGDSKVVRRMLSALTGLASTMGMSIDIKKLDEKDQTADIKRTDEKIMLDAQDQSNDIKRSDE